MNDFSDFIKLLARKKYILIFVPILSVLLTKYLVRDMPSEYMSKASIATGIADQSQNLLNSDDMLQKSEIEQKFANMIQMMMLKKIVDQISYKLILHDLTDPKPFRPASKLLSQLTPGAKKHAIEVYMAKYNSMSELSVADKDQKGLLDVIKSMGYDKESLMGKLVVLRANSSDFIDVKYESENAELCAFVANTHCREFIASHTAIIKRNQEKAVDFLGSLLQQKHDSLNARMNELKNYKTHNRILNLNEQARSLFGQIKDYESNKEAAEKDIIAYESAIKDIDNKFTAKDRKYLEATVTSINAAIIETKTRLNQLNDDYVLRNFDPSIKTRIDSLKEVLTVQINTSTDKYIFNPLIAKQSLVTKKLEMEVSLDLMRNSVGSIESELARLNKKFDGLVPHEAAIQSDEINIDVASKEYLEILNKYNQTTMATNYSSDIRQVEEALPGQPKASKKMMLIIISGLASFVVCLLVFFIMFYLDDTVQLSKHLAFKTKVAVLGDITLMNASKLSVASLLKGTIPAEMGSFKDAIRSIRFESDLEMKGQKLLAVTSAVNGEGKTFFSIGLACAYSLAKKRVLLIDGNFQHPTLSGFAPGAPFLEDFLHNELTASAFNTYEPIQVLANKGGDTSLFELSGEANIRKQLQHLQELFDIIIIDVPSLNSMNKVGEWILVSDKIAGVFEAGKSISKENKSQVEYLKSLDTKFIGWILNKVVSGVKPEKKKKKEKKKKQTA